LAPTAAHDLAGLQPTFAQPTEEGDRRHLELPGQFVQGPFICVALLPRGLPVRRADRHPLTQQQAGDHGTVEGLASFGRVPVLQVELLRDRRACQSVLM
jgi:hypothetical protein